MPNPAFSISSSIARFRWQPPKMYFHAGVRWSCHQRTPASGAREERILPWLIHLSMRQARLTPYRGRVVSTATGRVLEVGIGSGLNVPFYGRTVNQVVGLEPSPKLLDMAHKAALRRAAAMPACNAILVKPNQV